MWVCGAPCNNSTGGPDPPFRTLISAPIVGTRARVKPGKKRSVSPGTGAAAAAWDPGRPTAGAVAPARTGRAADTPASARA